METIPSPRLYTPLRIMATDSFSNPRRTLPTNPHCLLDEALHPRPSNLSRGSILRTFLAQWEQVLYSWQWKLAQLEKGKSKPESKPGISSPPYTDRQEAICLV